MTQYAAGLSLIASLLLIVLLDARRIGHLHTGDSDNLVEGARVALRCLGDGDVVGCGHLPGSVQTEVFPYPLLQYLPSGVLLRLGMSDGHVLAALGMLSYVAFAAALALVVITFRDRPRHGALIALALVGSSTLYHTTSAFGEGLVAALVVMTVCVAIRQQSAFVFVLVLASGLGKETLPLFVLALVLVSARSDERALLPPKRLTFAATGAAITALALNAGFNVFRYGTIKNLLYLDGSLHTPGLFNRLDFFAGIPLSPSSGVIWFWPLFSAIALAGTAIGTYRLCIGNARHNYLPVLSITVIMLLWFAGLSTWFSPFGWFAYGPRLEVPLLGGLVVAYVHTIGDVLVRGVQRLRLLRIIGLAVLLAGSLQFFSPWRYLQAINQLNVGGGSCPDPVETNVYENPDEYYRCVDMFMWRVRPSVFDNLVEAHPSWSVAGWLAGVAACVVLWHFVSTPSHTSAPDAKPANEQRSASARL